jgi:uncharacterized membrane protein SpoIIM required for sporulation
MIYKEIKHGSAMLLATSYGKKKKKEGDEEKIFKLYIYKIMIRKEIPIMIMWLAILLFLGYSYSKLEPMQNRKYKQHYKSNQIRKYSIIKNI